MKGILRRLAQKVGKAKKRNLIFFAAVPLIAASSLISTPCPVCNGTGKLATTPGMADVEISTYDAREWRVTRDACGLYILYFYDIDITLYNKAKKDAEGWLKLTLVDISKKERVPVVDTQYRSVSVPAETVVNFTYTVVFGTGIDAYGTTDVQIDILTGDVPDSTCQGTGRVPSNTWLFVNGLKTTFADTVKSETEYNPPNVIDWTDYTYFDE